MKTAIRHMALGALALLAAGSASAGANVKFIHPENFSDVPFTAWERERVLKELASHFDKLAARLPAGQEFNVEVTDIDLAGKTNPLKFRGQDIRIMNGGADWPHMTLRYTITQDGKVIKSGDESLSDMAYQDRMTGYGHRDDALRYEKRMIDQWFYERISPLDARRASR